MCAWLPMHLYGPLCIYACKRKKLRENETSGVWKYVDVSYKTNEKDESVKRQLIPFSCIYIHLLGICTGIHEKLGNDGIMTSGKNSPHLIYTWLAVMFTTTWCWVWRVWWWPLLGFISRATLSSISKSLRHFTWKHKCQQSQWGGPQNVMAVHLIVFQYFSLDKKWQPILTTSHTVFILKLTIKHDIT